MAEVEKIEYLDKDGGPGALGEKIRAVQVYFTDGATQILQRSDFHQLIMFSHRLSEADVYGRNRRQ